jgi:hypothetical protein
MPIHIFPHSYLPESLAEKIVSFLGPFTVYRPWMMETSFPVKDISIKILNPPAGLEPHESLKTILSEYKDWMERHRDRSYLETIKSGRDSGLEDNKTWEIRQMLGRKLQSVSVQEEQVSRWHLILHLEADIEKQRIAADNILESLKHKRSPLDGSIEKPLDMQILLGDLSDLGTEVLLKDRNLKQILEAWFGLFGEYIKENELFLTYDRQIMNYINQRWDAVGDADGFRNIPAIELNVPYLSGHGPYAGNQQRSDPEIDKMLREMKGIILSMAKTPEDNMRSLKTLSRTLVDFFPSESWDRTLRCTVRYLCPIPDEVMLQGENILRHLFNQTIIFAEE